MPAGVMWRYMLCLLGGALEGDKPNQQSQLGDSQTFKVFKGRFLVALGFGVRGLFWGELPLRGAAQWRGGGGCFWGTSRCAGLLH